MRLGAILAAAFAASCSSSQSTDVPEATSSRLASLSLISQASGEALVLTPPFSPDHDTYLATGNTGTVLRAKGTTEAPVFIVVVNGATADYPSANEFISPESLNLTIPRDVLVAGPRDRQKLAMAQPRLLDVAKKGCCDLGLANSPELSNPPARGTSDVSLLPAPSCLDARFCLRPRHRGVA